MHFKEEINDITFLNYRLLVLMIEGCSCRELRSQ